MTYKALKCISFRLCDNFSLSRYGYLKTLIGINITVRHDFLSIINNNFRRMFSC